MLTVGIRPVRELREKVDTDNKLKTKIAMAKFRKLIEVSQENEVVCDNPECDFVVPNVSKDPDADCKRFLNVACPKCGQNLLTEQDYLRWLALHKYVRFINKWFSWITVFIKEPKERQTIETHVHNGVKFTPQERGLAFVFNCFKYAHTLMREQMLYWFYALLCFSCRNFYTSMFKNLF